MITEYWNRPATIDRNNFKLKSLSSWSYNIAVGCEHACRFCYVPEVSTIRMGPKLAERGVKDPDAEWGDYVFLRDWHENKFQHSLRMAEATKDLNLDGNRAVMLCTTTDPYQVLKQPYGATRQNLVRWALKSILEKSTLNVRILTRSPLAQEDFDLMKEFGPRLLFGMSLPTLNNTLAKIYEPKAPAPSQRLSTLRAARDAGLNIYVAVAPVYPDCDDQDMRATLNAIGLLDPVTVFMEPINIRAGNVKRIEEHAKSLSVTVKTDVYSTPEAWREYAVRQLLMFESLAAEYGLRDRLHLWPDAALGSKDARRQFADDTHNWSEKISYVGWLQYHWNKISAWPK